MTARTVDTIRQAVSRAMLSTACTRGAKYSPVLFLNAGTYTRGKRGGWIRPQADKGQK